MAPLTTVAEILRFLEISVPDADPLTGIFGVAPLSRAGPDQMSFRDAANAETETHAGLVLSRYDFSRAAWKFFPPDPPVVKKDWSTCTKNIHPTAVIAKEAFGYERGPTGDLVRVPHWAGVTLGMDVSIGAYTVIDRGMFYDTTIGDGTKIDNLVHVGHSSRIGKRCLVIAGTVTGGSSIIGDDCFIGMNATIRDHIRVGNRVLVGMGAVVVSDVPDGVTVAGNPGRILTKK